MTVLVHELQSREHRVTFSAPRFCTALEALTQGVRMVAIPITNDNQAAAVRIAWTGPGRTQSKKKWNAKALRAEGSDMLTAPSFEAIPVPAT